MKFVHLHNHTHYSLLDGLTQISELIETAKEDGAPAVAITDHGTMYGVIEFYQKCRKAGIKPIIGVEAYLAPESRHKKETKSDERNYHLLLLAKNQEGYKNLLKLVSIAHLEGYYYKPRIDWEILQEYQEGIIACSACLAGEIPQLIQAGKMERAKKRALEYSKLFGKDNFYLEIQDHPSLPEQAAVNAEVIKLARELSIPLVATNDLHYLKPDDHDVQDVLLCLQTKRKKDDADRMEMHGQDFYYKTSKEMHEAFKDVPEALENTLKIAEMCDLEIELGKIQLPYFEVPGGVDENVYLRSLCEEGLVKRFGKTYGEIDETRRQRMDFELSVISKMGFPSYFLIVGDFVNWAKDNGIVVGPGRGSAAGSFVSYLTGITNLDPLEYDLLFERFLNPDRISMPDIDMDFADIRREEVIRYVEEKYGQDHVSQIITFGTMAARAAVRDVGRVLDYPYEFCDRLAKTIPSMMKMEKALKSSPELKAMYENEEGAKKIITYAQRLEGVARHASTHACGVLITKEPLTSYVPVQYASSSDRTIVSQYSLHPVEDLGLLKMDFLGLSNLTIIESAIKIIKKTRGIAIDIDKIPLDDKAAYELFQKGETTGVFQFESSGMKRYLRELKPNMFEDIIAMVALYRPGPMELIPDYIASKHGKKKIQYLHPKLEPILAKTYGVAIYQEQVMQMSRQLAGFTAGEADVLRKAMGKKIAELLAQQKDLFVEGCVKNAISKESAEAVWAFIEPFAGYGFNRSHAACYALIGYQTAYLKAHWPTEFMAALLTSDQDNTDRIAIEIEECRNMGIEVMAPDINQSFDSFTVVTSGTVEGKTAGKNEEVNTIRFGLKAIKNVGYHISEVLIEERKANGPFEDLSDLLKRVKDKDLNKKSLESLIKSGAMDAFGERGMLLSNIDMMLSFNKELAKASASAQTSLFGDLPMAKGLDSVRLKNAPPASRKEKLGWEKELLGLYITEHPFLDYKKNLEGLIIPLDRLAGSSRDKDVAVAGVISTIKKILTKNNENMLFVKIEDDTNGVEVLVFPRLYKETADIWREGSVIFGKGKISDKDNEVKLLLNNAIELKIETIEQDAAKARKLSGYSRKSNDQNHASSQEFGSLILEFRADISTQILEDLKNLLLDNSGSQKVFFRINNGNASYNTLETGLKVTNNQTLHEKIKRISASGINILDKK